MKRDKLGRFVNQDKFLTINCFWCGKEFKYYKSNKRGKFCSQKCSIQYRKKYGFLKGKNNPNWKGGINNDYCKRIAKENLDTSKCSICNSKRFICIHHKDGNRKNNKLVNLQIVCKSCHEKIHNKVMNIKRIRGILKWKKKKKDL